MSSYHVSPEDFRTLADLVCAKTGIVLDDSKSYLVETRLGPLMSEFGLDSYRQLAQAATSRSRVLDRLIDEISTNETYFFRDTSPFDLLKFRLLPDLLDRGGNASDLRIWSAASSTGQEVYSIAIACKEILGSQASTRVSILGTDISDAAVRQASRGSYSALEVNRGLSPGLRDRYFRPDGDRWVIDESLRAMASFRHANLLEPQTSLGRFDIIFCRNVAIYFDKPTRQRLFEGFAKQLKVGGCVVIGASETLVGITDIYERKEHMGCAYYKLKH